MLGGGGQSQPDFSTAFRRVSRGRGKARVDRDQEDVIMNTFFKQVFPNPFERCR